MQFSFSKLNLNPVFEVNVANTLKQTYPEMQFQKKSMFSTKLDSIFI